MSDSKPRNESKEKLPRLPVVVAGLIVVTGVAWYFWVKNDWDNAGTWGAIGDAVGPFTGLATALALGFAVYATMLQRKELELQRDEMRAQREEMALQRAEAAKAAAAQERLATSQERLAAAQEAANALAVANTKAQKSNTMAVAAAALWQIEMTISNTQALGPEHEKKAKQASLNTSGILRGILANDGEWRTRDDAPKDEPQ